ncbi:zinc transporter ZIP11-like isoform X2 [Portunus trituberculatus]|uniref:zinc transporter ZIP11-like isoform X2 n=1 Tax=Portunus trituberculatus TaxID=210409 RepID=UPI001E1CC74C|nr:zinc transporter ZIP11-like isoform X2 [Portunus trituberculatus]
MISGLSPVSQAMIGTLFTWGLTAAGSAVVFFLAGTKRKVLDGSLGFAAGVMTAASFWSLLAPAIELAETSGSYGAEGEWAFIPVAFGFLLGALFVYAADELMSSYGIQSSNIMGIQPDKKKEDDVYTFEAHTHYHHPSMSNDLKQRRGEAGSRATGAVNDEEDQNYGKSSKHNLWRRILLLIIAITVHNIPEGLAVGVGFGAVGKTPLATFTKAKNLALGIGIQNFPEGMAVSLPLRGAGHSVWWAFWYGQLSGMVEPAAGVLGALAVSYCEPVLPYALAFAAGAMIFVVMDDIIPEAQMGGNGRWASGWCIVGFIVMMALDVALG